MIHAFDAEALRADPDQAYLYTVDSGGDAPVGIAVFDQDRHIAVTNSNRFDPTQGTANIAIFDVSDRSTAKLVKILDSGLFPRDIYVHPDQSSFFVANWESKTFQEITLTYVPEEKSGAHSRPANPGQ